VAAHTWRARSDSDPRTQFNIISLGLALSADGELPIVIELTPENVADFAAAGDSGCETSIPREPAALWNSVMARMREWTPDSWTSTICRTRKRKLILTFEVASPSLVRARIEAGAPMARPEEIERRLGIRPNRDVIVASSDAHLLIESQLVHGTSEAFQAREL